MFDQGIEYEREPEMAAVKVNTVSGVPLEYCRA